MVKKIVGTGVLLVLALALQAGVKMYTLKSPDGKVKLEVTAGQGIASVSYTHLTLPTKA